MDARAEIAGSEDGVLGYLGCFWRASDPSLDTRALSFLLFGKQQSCIFASCRRKGAHK